jgi:hypothetical protein
MIDYLLEVKPLQDSGMSNSEIAAHLNAKTNGPLPAAEAEYVLQDSGACLKDPVSGDKFGSLITYYAGLEDGDAKNLIAFALDRIYSGQPVNLHEPPRAVQFQSVAATLPQDLQIVCDSLIEVAGGRPYDGSVTEANVAQSQTEWEAAEAARIEAEQQAQAEAEAEQLVNQQLLELNSRYVALHNQFVGSALIDQRVVDEAQWVAGIQAMADNFLE